MKTNGVTAMPGCALHELSLGDVVTMLASRADDAAPVTDSPVDTSEVFVESFLRSVSMDRPSRYSAYIVGKVEFRSGEGPLFEIGVREVEIETTWADVLFLWGEGDARQMASMPLSSFSRYIVQGCVVVES